MLFYHNSLPRCLLRIAWQPTPGSPSMRTSAVQYSNTFDLRRKRIQDASMYLGSSSSQPRIKPLRLKCKKNSNCYLQVHAPFQRRSYLHLNYVCS